MIGQQENRFQKAIALPLNRMQALLLVKINICPSLNNFIKNNSNPNSQNQFHLAVILESFQIV